MDVYQLVDHDNEQILLKRINADTDCSADCYTIVRQDNGDILLKKTVITKITCIDNLKIHNFASSEVLSCSIDDCELGRLTYRNMLNYVYKSIGDGAKIIKNSILNIKTIEKSDAGFYYIADIGISIQGANSNKCLFETIQQCVKNDIKVDIKIKLDDDTLIELVF